MNLAVCRECRQGELVGFVVDLGGRADIPVQRVANVEELYEVLTGPDEDTGEYVQLECELCGFGGDEDYKLVRVLPDRIVVERR